MIYDILKLYRVIHDQKDSIIMASDTKLASSI